MQITMLALGSRGDVQPYVALGKGLQDAGHTVRILTSQDFQWLFPRMAAVVHHGGAGTTALGRRPVDRHPLHGRPAVLGPPCP